jgi:hypothetical protein
MTTSRFELQKTPNKPTAGLTLDPRGIAQVEAERKRLGITEEMLERSRNASLERPF